MYNRDYDWRTRLDRAFTQRIYLMDASGSPPESLEPDYHFKVMGNSGLPYDLVIDSQNLYCSCPDHSQRGNLCKHLMFVLIRAMGHTTDSVFETYFSNNTFTPSALTLAKCKLFLDRRSQGLIDINYQPAPSPRHLPAVVKDVPQKTIEPDDDCPICYEDFTTTQGESVVWCRASCGKSLHENCFVKWAQEAERKRTPVSCVYCRAKWR